MEHRHGRWRHKRESGGSGSARPQHALARNGIYRLAAYDSAVFHGDMKLREIIYLDDVDEVPLEMLQFSCRATQLNGAIEDGEYLH